MAVALLRSADSGLRCLALLIRAGAAALCARSRVSRHPHTASRDCRNGHPCPCEPVCACIGMRTRGKRTSRANDAAGEKRHTAFLSPTPHAAQRPFCRDGGVGWEGGADLASAGVCGPTPPQHATSARHGSPPPRPAKHGSAPNKNRHATTKASRNTSPPPNKPISPATATKHVWST